MTDTAARLCPICQRPSAPPGDRSPRPFCSARCQMVDLGRWFDEEYKVSEPASDAERAGEVAPTGPRDVN